MAILKPKIQTFEDLFLMKMQVIYDVESEILKALPKMIKKATDPDLEKALSGHLAETEIQKERVEQIFDMVGAKPKKMACAAIRGLVADAEDVIAMKPPSELLDAALIGAARSVEHFEMSKYMAAISWAEALGHADAAKLLETTLEEERSADLKLVEAAETVNERALETVIGDEDEDE
ncbi:MAG: DUF892 family protein [Candidatus Taylorbacteria bacterium]|nr:DUF892 family protein [Candidatus Taylorbacteria bacterium]